jgi:hypothetical protein
MNEVNIFVSNEFNIYLRAINGSDKIHIQHSLMPQLYYMVESQQQNLCKKSTKENCNCKIAHHTIQLQEEDPEY